MITYMPQPAPQTKDNPLVGYTYRELMALSVKLRQSLVFEEQIAAPNKPVEGQVEFADGTTWNPGGGKGLYVYYSSAWNKLG